MADVGMGSLSHPIPSHVGLLNSRGAGAAGPPGGDLGIPEAGLA